MILDTYAWVEYFLGSPKGRVVKDLLEKGAYTPDVVLAEIA
ncbi:MAG: type II toxin-antitoxin system VapC family toxin, partial [Thermoprotei archaeon]